MLSLRFATEKEHDKTHIFIEPFYGVIDTDTDKIIPLINSQKMKTNYAVLSHGSFVLILSHSLIHECSWNRKPAFTSESTKLGEQLLGYSEGGDKRSNAFMDLLYCINILNLTKIP